MALLVRAHRIGAVIVDRHIGGFGPTGRALHGAAACGGHQQGDQVLPVGQLQAAAPYSAPLAGQKAPR